MGGYRIGSFRGIPIRIHPTFLIILPLLAWQFARMFRLAAQRAEVPPERLHGSPWLWGVGVAVALFASVLVHELAHSIYARAKGGRVGGITLLMIGGVSEITEMPRRARDEALMALVGPLTSLALGGGFYLLHRAAGGTGSFHFAFALFYLFYINVFLGLFNLLPAFPMDGGRIVRALLAPSLGVPRATRIAATLGKGFAALFALVGIFGGNFLLVLIAVFVYLGAEGEAGQVRARSLFGAVTVREVMRAETPPEIPPSASAAEAAARMVAARQPALVVVDPRGDRRPAGVVTATAVGKVPPGRRPDVSIAAIMTRVDPVAPDDPLARAFQLLGAGALPMVPVVEHGRLLGLLRDEDVARWLQLAQLEGPPRARAHGFVGPPRAYPR